MRITYPDNVERVLFMPLDPFTDLPFSFSWALSYFQSEVWFGWFESTERPGLWALDHPTNMYEVYNKNCNHGQTQPH